MSKGGSQTTSTSIDPQIKEAFLQNVQQARNVAGALPVQQFAGYNPLYQAGEEAIVNQSLTPFTGQEIGGFMNPYTQEVIDRSLGDIESSRQMQDLRDRQAATQARAFGGSRQGVQSSLTNAAALKQAADLSANLRNQGFGQATQLAQYARGQNLQGGQNVMALGGARQAFEQQQLDAIRNIGLQKLGIVQSSLGATPANLGGSVSTPYTRNAASGALGGALAGGQMFGPYGAIAGGLLGAIG